MSYYSKLDHMREGYTYDDVLIQPGYSEIESRQDIDILTDFLGLKVLPIISSPMDTVSGPEMVAALAELGAYGILHRFAGVGDKVLNLIETSRLTKKPYGISIGVKDWFHDETYLNTAIYVDNPPHSVTIDVAHGHHALTLDTIKKVRTWKERTSSPIKIIAGNVATLSGFHLLADFGVDAIRVGIGPGSACTTRETTGIGVPQLTALENAAFIKHNFNPNVQIIADGGIQKPGDIAKAIAAGADTVMLGRLLAGADEAPEGTTYRGQSSVGSNAARGAPEGISGTVEQTGPVSGTINSLMHYLRSSMSYVGSSNLENFRTYAEFIKVSPGTAEETRARL